MARKAKPMICSYCGEQLPTGEVIKVITWESRSEPDYFCDDDHCTAWMADTGVRWLNPNPQPDVDA